MNIQESSAVNINLTNSPDEQIALISERWRTCWIIFVILLIITSSHTLNYLFQNYDDPTGPYAIYIFILGMLRIAAWVGMVIHLAYYAHKFTNKKIWLLNGLFGVLAFSEIFPLLGLLLIYLQKNKRIKELKPPGPTSASNPVMP